MMRLRSLLALSVGLVLVPAAQAEPTVSTFTLDALSYVSFEDEDVFPIPSGGTLSFHFGDANPNGSVPFTLTPGDVSIPPIPVAGGDTLTYELKSPTSGLCTGAPGSKTLQFAAIISAKLETSEGVGSFEYAMTFTTQTAAATNTAGTESVSVQGMPLNETARAMQLVGAATSKEGSYPGPGKAVYTILSGTFDQLP